MTAPCQGFLLPSVVIRETRIKKRSCHITSWSLCLTTRCLKAIPGHRRPAKKLCKDLQAEAGVLLRDASQRLLPASSYPGACVVHVQGDEACVCVCFWLCQPTAMHLASAWLKVRLCSIETGGGGGAARCPGTQLRVPISTTACLHCFFFFPFFTLCLGCFFYNASGKLHHFPFL